MSIPNPPPPNSSQRNSIVHLESDSSLHPQPATKILQEKFPLSYEDNNPLSTSKLRPTVRNRRLRTYSKDSGLTKREGEGVRLGAEFMWKTLKCFVTLMEFRCGLLSLGLADPVLKLIEYLKSLGEKGENE